MNRGERLRAIRQVCRAVILAHIEDSGFNRTRARHSIMRSLEISFSESAYVFDTLASRLWSIRGRYKPHELNWIMEAHFEKSLPEYTRVDEK